MKVGQKVWMQSGSLRKEATVIGITPHRIEVEPVLFGDETRYSIHFRQKGKPGTIFDNNKQCGVWVCVGGGESGWVEYDRRPLCTEFGPWELVDRLD